MSFDGESARRIFLFAAVVIGGASGCGTPPAAPAADTAATALTAATDAAATKIPALTTDPATNAPATTPDPTATKDPAAPAKDPVATTKPAGTPSPDATAALDAANTVERKARFDLDNCEQQLANLAGALDQGQKDPPSKERDAEIVRLQSEIQKLQAQEPILKAALAAAEKHTAELQAATKTAAAPGQPK